MLPHHTLKRGRTKSTRCNYSNGLPFLKENAIPAECGLGGRNVFHSHFLQSITRSPSGQAEDE